VGARFALRALDTKLISSLQGGVQFFDLTQDPAEQRNLASADPRRTGQAERILAGLVARVIRDGERFDRRTVVVAPAVLDRLRALGYVR
jgi:hypothetical protein